MNVCGSGVCVVWHFCEICQLCVCSVEQVWMLCVYSVDLVRVLCGTCVEHVGCVEHVWVSRQL